MFSNQRTEQMTKQDSLKYIDEIHCLVDNLSSVVDCLLKTRSDELYLSKAFQLKEINKAIKAIEKRDIAVPDSLRSEKSKLINELNDLKVSHEIDIIKERLLEIIKKLDYSETRISKHKQNKPKLPKTDNAVYRKIIISCLEENGGIGRAKDVIAEIEKRLEGKFKPGDLQNRADGRTIVWKNNAQWEKFKMVEDGILKDDSPRGFWELKKSDNYSRIL
jgi:hypothetical protein